MWSGFCAEEEIERPPPGDPPGALPPSHRAQGALTHVAEGVRFAGGERGRLVMRNETRVVADAELRDLEYGVHRQRRRIQENRDAAHRFRSELLWKPERVDEQQSRIATAR